MKKNISAFSLLELSLVLVVIGILITCLLKGTALASASKMKSAQSLTTSSQVAGIDNMVLWLETTLKGSLTNSANSQILANNDLVASWNDINQQISAKSTVYQATGTKMPTFVADGINGLPSLRFDGIDDMLKNTVSGSTPICLGDDSYTIAIVWKADSQGVPRYLVSESGSSAATHRVASIYIDAANNSGFVGANNNYISIPVVKGTSYATIVRVNNSNTQNVSLWYNANNPTTGASTNASALDLDNSFFEVGSISNSAFFSGLISEIIIYDRDLNVEEIKILNNYLSKKYSIKLN